MLPAVSPRTLLTAVVAATVTLSGLNLVLRLVEPDRRAEPFPGHRQLVDLFSVDVEGNVTTWFSAALLLAIGLVALAIAAEQRRQQQACWRRHWIALGLIFVYLSVDEAARLHERATPLLKQVVEASGVLVHVWVVLGAPLVLLFALAYLPFLRALPRRIGRLLALAGVTFVAGGLGMELVGSWLISGNHFFFAPYVWATSVEELLELLGASVCLYALALHAESLKLPDAGPAVEGIRPSRDGVRT
jgi:hypothetical protein